VLVAQQKLSEDIKRTLNYYETMNLKCCISLQYTDLEISVIICLFAS